jgi:small subunit ribosomal protein S20
MANHYSALKRARQTETKTAVNRANKSRMRTALRKLRTAIAEGDKAAVTTSYSEAASVLDQSAKKGVIHKNTASRYKSRLAKRAKAAVTK